MKAILSILSGLPASAKSTLSKLIVKEYNAAYLRIDTVEQGLKDLYTIYAILKYKEKGTVYRTE